MYQSARKRKAAGIQPFENVPPGVLQFAKEGKTRGPSETAHYAADFPEYEAASDDGSSDEEQQ